MQGLTLQKEFHSVSADVRRILTHVCFQDVYSTVTDSKSSVNYIVQYSFVSDVKVITVFL